MPQIYGQLLNAQLENSTGAPSGATPNGRMYLDVTSTSASVPYIYDGTAYRTLGVFGLGGGTLGATTPTLAYGTFTPTLTNVTNVSSSTANSSTGWFRVGNCVTVFGTVIVNTSGTGAAMRMSLPTTTSNFSNTSQAGGVCSIIGGTTAASGSISSVSSAQVVSFNFPLNVAGTFAFHFSYTVQ